MVRVYAIPASYQLGIQIVAKIHDPCAAHKMSPAMTLMAPDGSELLIMPFALMGIADDRRQLSLQRILPPI